MILFSSICTTFIVYALMYNMEKLSGSLYWNSAIIGVSADGNDEKYGEMKKIRKRHEGNAT